VWAYGDHGEEGIGAGAEDAEVAGGFVDDEKHGGTRGGIGSVETHGAGSRADVDGLVDAAIVDVDGNNAAGGAVGHVHPAGIGADDGVGGSGAEEHVVAQFVSPGVDDLQAMSVGRNHVKFAAIGFDQHLRGITSEFEIGDEDAAAKIDDREAFFGAAQDEGYSAVGNDEDFVRLRDNGDGGALLERGGIVDAKGGRATIDDQNEFFVGRGPGLHRFGSGFGTSDDDARRDVDGEELIGGGGGGVGAIARGREVDGERKRADGDAPGNLRSARVKYPQVAASGADSPNFGALGVFAHVGDAGSDGNSLDDVEIGEIEDSDGAVGGRDIGVEVKIGAEERGAMFAEKYDDEEDEQDGENEIDSDRFEVRHGMDEFTGRGSGCTTEDGEEDRIARPIFEGADCLPRSLRCATTVCAARTVEGGASPAPTKLRELESIEVIRISSGGDVGKRAVIRRSPN